ncbi:MAG: hypothetical protein EXQ90_00210 [Rhodospirillales bacterium]|nr:hypothetical protein [Rhodospirillales bacterium]
MSYSWLTDDSGVQLHGKAGLLASFVWFASYEILGNKATRLYDASMSEWSLAQANPVERHIAVD